LALLLLLASSAFVTGQSVSVSKYAEPKSLAGTIYSSDHKAVLFKFSRRLTGSGARLEALREYTYSDGKLAAREHVVYNGDDLHSYQLEELQTGGYGRATVKPDPRAPGKKVLEFEYSKDSASRATPRRSAETLRNDTLNNDMVGPFLAAHWDALMKGEEVKCRFIVLSRRETVGFKFTKESESQWQGKPIVILRMEPTSPLIRPLVDALHFKIEKEGAHHVLEYSGRTTPKIKSGNKWEDLDAVTVFDW
jgi:hypothetical protein